MERPRAEYIVQIENMYLNEFTFLWIYHNQPCSLVFMKPKTEGLTAVKLAVTNDEAAEFVKKSVDRLGVKLYKTN